MGKTSRTSLGENQAKNTELRNRTLGFRCVVFVRRTVTVPQILRHSGQQEVKNRKIKKRICLCCPHVKYERVSSVTAERTEPEGL